MTLEMQQIVDSIPLIQAQISQISLMLNNPSLPKAVRQTTEMQHQQLQMQLQQAQAVSAALATIQQQTAAAQTAANAVVPNGGVYTSNMGMGQTGPKWTNPYSSLPPAGMDSAYQRLPINNRRRNLKRERPSDFLEVAGDSKVPRYWE
jgi:protein MPE1